MKWPYLGSWAKNKKNKDTFFSSTFKVCLISVLMAQRPRYWHFLPLTMVHTSLPELQYIKWQYLGPWAMNKKTKDTLLSQTLKVEENKVSLFFWFMAQELRYGHFLFWRQGDGSETALLIRMQECCHEE